MTATKSLGDSFRRSLRGMPAISGPGTERQSSPAKTIGIGQPASSEQDLTRKFTHKTLDMLMRKAQKFEEEAHPKIIEQKSVQTHGLIKLAEQFTNKRDFQETFLRQSDRFSSPPKEVKLQQSIVEEPSNPEEAALKK